MVTVEASQLSRRQGLTFAGDRQIKAETHSVLALVSLSGPSFYWQSYFSLKFWLGQSGALYFESLLWASFYNNFTFYLSILQWKWNNGACAFDPNFWPKLKLILCDNFPVDSQTESQIPAQTLVADFHFLPLLFPLINCLLSTLGTEQSTVATSFDKDAVSQRLSATVSLCSTILLQIEWNIQRQS